MSYSTSYHNAVLYLAHLIISADGIIDDNEIQALESIKEEDSIPDEVFNDYKNSVQGMREKQIYERAIDLVSECTDEEKLRAFCWLYKISEVDGTVHVKEVRFLLYSVKRAGIEFEDVVDAAKSYPAII